MVTIKASDQSCHRRGRVADVIFVTLFGTGFGIFKRTEIRKSLISIVIFFVLIIFIRLPIIYLVHTIMICSEDLNLGMYYISYLNDACEKVNVRFESSANRFEDTDLTVMNMSFMF